MGTARRALMWSAPSWASAADDIAALMICEMVRMAPLLLGKAVFSEQKKWPPALLRAWVSDKQDASL